MKSILLLCLSLVLLVRAGAQVFNPGFETGRDTAAALPAGWWLSTGTAATALRVPGAGRSGTAALRIAAADSGFSSFSQAVPCFTRAARKVRLRAWLRTSAVRGAAGLWCQVRDTAGRLTGFRNLEQAGDTVRGSQPWREHGYSLIVPAGTAQLVLGGSLRGSGTAFFDAVALDTAAAIAEPSATVQK